MKILLPGTFVVMQGTPGDGIINSIDTMPVVDYIDDSEFLARMSSSNMDQSMNEFREHQEYSFIMNSVENESVPAIERVECALDIASKKKSQVPYCRPIKNGTATELDQTIDRSYSTIEMEAIEKWKLECIERAISMDHHHIFKSCNPQTASSGISQESNTETYSHNWWASNDGRLCVFDTLPTIKDQSLSLGSVVDALPPGATVQGDEMILLDSIQFNILCRVPDASDAWDITNTSLKGLCLFLRISLPCEGYLLLNLDGYYFVSYGQPSDYISPHFWIWRVSYAEGALVRKGLELDSVHVVTVPFGGFVRVCRKTVNDMGLSRLAIECIQGIHIESEISSPNSSKSIKQTLGWVSEFLNPLSGRRGNILQPLAFPVPVLYRVRLPQGAIIRSGIELSSQEIGHAPYGSILSVVGRSFTGMSVLSS